MHAKSIHDTEKFTHISSFLMSHQVSGRPRRSARGSSLSFLSLLVLLVFALYGNSLSSGYVWDDRAAIVGNKDVHGKTPLSTVLKHDFWGQDITEARSHKSYRPLTVLSYRLNHFFTELSPFGFHLGNAVIYVATVCVFYLAATRWLSEESSQVAALLFACHPVHCEAVSSLVGRADCLSGLFFIASLLCYSDALGCLRSSQDAQSMLRVWGLFIASYILAFMASFAKEIGMTVFGMYAIFEVLYASSLSHKLQKHFLRDKIVGVIESEGEKVNIDHEEQVRWVYWLDEWRCHGIFISDILSRVYSSLSFKHPTYAIRIVFTYLQSVWIPTKINDVATQSDALHSNKPKSFREIWKWFFKFPVGIYVRLVLSCSCIGLLLYFRSLLHGETQLYEWTIMENPVSLESRRLTRMLSYAHTHYLMLLKLLNPVTPHCCFDYGHKCLPIISECFRLINCLSLCSYAGIIYVSLDALLLAKRTSLLAICLLLLPIVPALNVLFPVGTLLAERLLFVPSMGVCLWFGDVIVNWYSDIWTSIGDHWNELLAAKISQKKRTNITFPMSKAAVFVSLFPLFVIMSYRVIERNTEWRDEYSIYRSALNVCPNNYKALTNTGMLLLNKNRRKNAREAAMLSDRALQVHKYHQTAYLNSALSHSADKKFVRSLYLYKQAEVLVKDQNFKLLYQYMGVALNDYVQSLEVHNRQASNPFFLPNISSKQGYTVDESMTVWRKVISLLRADTANVIDYAIQLGMHNPVALFVRASLSIEIGTPEEYERAAELLERVIIKNKDLERQAMLGVPVQDTVSLENAYNQRAIALMGLKRYDEAEECYITGIRLSPMLWQSYVNLATLYFELKQYEKAKEVLIAGAEVYEKNVEGPMHLAFMLQLGFCENKLGDNHAAYNYFDKGFKLIDDFKAAGYDFDKDLASKIVHGRSAMRKLISP